MRPETGLMKFNEDWTGVFIRGDNAFWFAMALSRIIQTYKQIPGEKDVFGMIGPLENLLDILEQSDERNKNTDVQQMKSLRIA